MCITMASSVSSQFPNMDENETVFAEFIKEKIEKAGGQIKFQHITGHLSQLALSVRETVGSSPRDLKKFLTKHNGLFNVDSDGFVSFQKSPVVVTEKKNQNSRIDNDSDSLFPMTLKEVPGIVIKVLPTFGFATIKHPIKTSIYFTPSVVSDKNFEIKDGKGCLLTDIPGMLPGKKVLINAKKANTNFENKYRATRVWTPPIVKNQVLVPEGFLPKVPKDGLYDPVAIEGSGRVQKVFEQFGFITNDNPSENIFFHKSKVCNVQNIMNLAKVFSPGDIVEFKAIRSTKKDIKVRWEASKVWIKKGKTNLFKHDSGLSEGDSQSQKTVQPPDSAKSREMLNNLPGKIFPHNDGVVIKFGKNDTQLADADSCPFYLNGVEVLDVCWEFSDGDKVNFDGIKIKSAPGFKAIVAWVGAKPNVVLPVHVGDFTEFSDDENESVTENIIPDKKAALVRPPGFTKQPKREQYSQSSDRSRIFTPSSKVSNSSSRSASKSRSSVDKDFDLHSEDTLSTISGETQPSGHRRRRNRRSRYNASKPVHKVNSYSSLTDDTAMDSEDSYTNQDTVEFHNSDINRDDEGSNFLPQTTLKPCSSLDSLDLKACLKPNPDVYKNWGDSPYLEEDNNEICSATKEESSLTTDIDPQFEQDNLVRKNTAEKASSHIKSLKEMFPSDDEFSDAEENFTNIDSKDKTQKPVEDINDSPNVIPKDASTQPAYEDIMNLSDSEKDTGTESKLSPCVKCFFDLEGKLLKVFCKYAELEHNKLMKSISVLWSDLYHNGVPVSDKFDDMKEIIKSGQTINFSCIEIVDDEGALWQKVTAAWKGQKPKIKDMTPQEYIKQNFLHVSVDEKDFDYGTSENPFLAKVPLNVTAEPAASNVAAAPRKFLSIADSDDDESEPDIPTIVENKVPRMNIEVTPLEENEPEEMDDSLDSLDEEEDLAEAVSQMISSCIDTQVDIRALSSNIINLVRSKTAVSKSGKLSPTDLEVIAFCKECESRPTEALQLEPKNETKDSDTQTIITGDVIAQSIFTMGE